MKNIHAILLSVVFIGSIAAPSRASGADKTKGTVQPYGEVGGEWELVPALSDEFDANSVDDKKWDYDPNDWGPWSWEADNVKQAAGTLNLTMEYQPHERGGQKLFYTSGIIKSYETFQYGYMEAKIKGCEQFPGVCPAFWAINSIKKNGVQSGGEIDVMEILEVRNDVRQIDCNLHARPNGESKQKMVHQRRHWKAPWDPREDFHVYACEWTKDSITWYIDGKKRLTAPNEHWHIPLKVYVSMGLRPPYVVYDKRNPTNPEAVSRYPAPEASSGKGFPTTMQVEYVRVWQRK